MARGFGDLYYVRNIVYQRISSHEQKAFGNNFFKTTILNAAKEIRRHLPVMLPPLALGYLHLKWATDTRAKMIRKDPKLNDD